MGLDQTHQHSSADIMQADDPHTPINPSGGGGVEVLEDPGNVWERNAVVAEGHRIAAILPITAGDSTPRVFEVAVGGTSDSIPDGFADDNAGFEISLTPLGITRDVDPVRWRYLGAVGELGWDIVPQLPGVSVAGPEADIARFTFTSVAEPGDSESLIELNSVVDDVAVPVFQAKTDGDADWWLDLNTGAGFRFNQSADGEPDPAAGTAQFTTDGVSITVGANRFEVHYDPFYIRVDGLPTADPGEFHAGDLYTDGVPAAGVPKALMVSGG